MILCSSLEICVAGPGSIRHRKEMQRLLRRALSSGIRDGLSGHLTLVNLVCHDQTRRTEPQIVTRALTARLQTSPSARVSISYRDLSTKEGSKGRCTPVSRVIAMPNMSSLKQACPPSCAADRDKVICLPRGDFASIGSYIAAKPN